MRDYKRLKEEALFILETRLSPRLYYHGISHTLDVLAVCDAYIFRSELEPGPAGLLRIGALLHDLGYTVSTSRHEAHSIKLAAPILKKYGYDEADFEQVKELILATRIPQSPQTMSEKILCDADLDYLGRDDFYEISELLYRELKGFSKVTDRAEWDRRQVQFLEAHEYHTELARVRRGPMKAARLAELKVRIGGETPGKA